jgi:hypothetical protein
MEAPVEKRRFAWQPLTPRGVSAFAHASLGRLLLIQFGVALLAAAVAIWFLHNAWFSEVSTAISQMPAQGEVRGGKLQWPGDSPVRLAENRFLAIAVDLDHSGEMRSPAHVQVEFGREDLKVFSLLGFVQSAYPRGWVVAFNRVELQPWWGAWAPPLLAMAGAAAVGGLMLSWAALATVYCWIAWLIGFLANRDSSFSGSWRLAGAALMPGALFLTGAMVLYGLGALDLVRLAFAGAVHLVMGWVYLLISPLCLPPHPAAIAAEKGNPFTPPENKG